METILVPSFLNFINLSVNFCKISRSVNRVALYFAELSHLSDLVLDRDMLLPDDFVDLVRAD